MRGTRKPKAKRSKRVTYQVIAHDSAAGKVLYPMLNELIEEHHEELTNARIALAWSLTWKPDTDGRVKLGQCKKRSELDREFNDLDFVIVLRQEFVQSPEVKDAQRRALLDHELCHATIRLDREGEPALDERGRKVYRLRKHDIEEFSEIVARHGCYKRDLEHFAVALNQSKQRSLLDDESAPAPTPTPTNGAAHATAGNGKQAHASVSKARTRPKGPLSRKARARA